MLRLWVTTGRPAGLGRIGLPFFGTKCATAMNVCDPDSDDRRPYRPMTVANIRAAETTDFVEVVFLESARFYRLERSNRNFTEALELMQRAWSEGGTVMVALEAPDSDVIFKVKAG